MKTRITNALRRMVLRAESSGTLAGWPSMPKGPVVSEDYSPSDLLELPAAGLALTFLGGELAALPRSIERLGADGQWERVDDRPGDPDTLLASTWEPGVTASHGLRQIVQALYLHGAAPIYVRRDREPELVVLPPKSVTRTSTRGILSYNFSDAQIPDVPNLIPVEDLIYLEHMAPLNRVDEPISPFSRVWPSIRSAIGAYRYLANYWAKAATGSVAWVTDDSEPPDMDALQDYIWRLGNRMRARGQSDMVAPPGWKPVSMSASPEQAQMHQRVLEGTLAVSQVMGIPTTLLMDLSQGTLSNVAQMRRTFAQGTLASLARQVAEELSMVVWPDGTTRLAFDLSDPGDESRGDTARRLQTLAFSGIITANEARHVLRLPESEDEQADQLIRSTNAPAINIDGSPVESPQGDGPEDEDDIGNPDPDGEDV